MKKALVVLILIVLLALLTGCVVNNGTVIDKRFTAEHKAFSPYVVMIGKQTQIIPRWIHHSDSWEILVSDGEYTEWWQVSEEYYNKTNIGDTVDRRKGGNSDETD